ncbi:MAG: hypothetical protein EA393_01670 [Bacteroidetes bacterium]|nr:MAG: hypothetical protein EA393_01670 [Bacteroidota bacterium]
MKKLYALGVFISILFLPAKIWGQYIVDFEGPGETKGSYATDTVNLNGLEWELTEALIGTSINDKKNGNRSMRMRRSGDDAGTAKMLENKTNGVGTISFLYARYGSDTGQPNLFVEYSSDDGSTWIQAGETITDFPDELTLWSEKMNIPGNVIIRFRTDLNGTNQSRFNIDDIILTDFETIDFDDAGKWIAGSGGITSYQTDHIYQDKNWTFTEGPALRQTSTVQDDVPGSLGIYAWRLQDASGTEWTATYNSRGYISAFGFKVRRWDESPEPDWSVQYSIDGGETFFSSLVTINNEFLDFSSDWKVFSYSLPETLAVDCGDFVVKISRNGGERIMIDDFAFLLEEDENNNWYYRTSESGDWDNACIWEYSENGIDNWVEAFSVPGANAASIMISEGENIKIKDNISIGNLIISTGAELELISGTLNLISGSQLEVQDGGVIHFNGGEIPSIGDGAVIINKMNGTIRVSVNKSGLSNATAGNASEGKYFYETNSVFEWNNNSSFATSGQVYFPDAINESPIFKISETNSVTLSLGTNPTIFNGLFRAEGNITFQNPGTKTFRNGITGTGTVTQAESSGKFVIDGNTAQLGGSGALILNGPGLEITSPNLELISDKTISGSMPLTLAGSLNAGNHTLNLAGDFIITEDGEFNFGTSSVVFNGTALQTFQAADETSFYNLKLENPSDLLIESPVIVQNTLELSQGNIINENSAVTLGISPEEPGELLLAEGFIKGIFRRHIPAEADTEWLFPIGRDQHEAPVKILFTSPPETGGILETLYITVIPDDFYGNLPINDDDLIIDILFDAGFWRIQALQGLNDGVYNISLGVSDTLFDRIDNYAEVRILKRETPESDWSVAGTFTSADSDFINHIDVDSGFSEFAIGSDRLLNPLPIELLFFKAEAENNHVKLFWATASEINNEVFTLERTTNMREIEIIGSKPGAGNSNAVLRYSYTDRNPHPGISYYRLKQTDYDGSFEYSDWVAVRVNPVAGNELEILRLFRQHDSVFLLLQTQPRSNLEIRVTDIYGREIHHGRMQSASATARYSFIPNTTGLILITVSDGQKRVSGRMIIR